MSICKIIMAGCIEFIRIQLRKFIIGLLRQVFDFLLKNQLKYIMNFTFSLSKKQDLTNIKNNSI